MRKRGTYIRQRRIQQPSLTRILHQVAFELETRRVSEGTTAIDANLAYAAGYHARAAGYHLLSKFVDRATLELTHQSHNTWRSFSVPVLREDVTQQIPERLAIHVCRWLTDDALAKPSTLSVY